MYIERTRLNTIIMDVCVGYALFSMGSHIQKMFTLILSKATYKIKYWQAKSVKKNSFEK